MGQPCQGIIAFLSGLPARGDLGMPFVIRDVVAYVALTIPIVYPFAAIPGLGTSQS
jgi:hypothetical protein